MKISNYHLSLVAIAIFFAVFAYAFVVQGQTLSLRDRVRQAIEERRASGQRLLQDSVAGKAFFRSVISLQRESLGNIRQKIAGRKRLPADIKLSLFALFDARIIEVEGQAKELETITSTETLRSFIQGLKSSRHAFRAEVRSVVSSYLSSKGFTLIDDLEKREKLLEQKLTELKQHSIDTSQIEERLRRADDLLERAKKLLEGEPANELSLLSLAQAFRFRTMATPQSAAVFKETADTLDQATGEFKSALTLINKEIETSPSASAPSRIISFTVKPSVTDAAISDANGSHIVYLPSAQKREKLFVFMPGTDGMPKHTTYINQTAASVRYHAIDLAYTNNISAREGCARILNPDCQEDMRMEIITGTDTSPIVEVNRSNSIENRLIKLLEYLIRTRPAQEGWGLFLSNGNVNWGMVVAAGHSQGGGHAAMLGKTRLLDRVVMFAATEPAAWTKDPFVTPVERFYGFMHTKDLLAYPESVTSWKNIGLPGTETSVDGKMSPFNNSHQLVTSSTRKECQGDDAHGCVVTDLKTPLNAKGVPLFQNVWRYLIVSDISVPISRAKHIFFSSQTYTGNLGGLAGADQKCQTLAQNTGLTGTFKAWLSDSVTAAKDRLTHATVPYALVDGTKVANDWNDLTDFKINVPINITETGVVTSSYAWTATKANGERRYVEILGATTDNITCDNWTSSSLLFHGSLGNSSETGQYWSDWGIGSCDTSKHLYCVEQ